MPNSKNSTRSTRQSGSKKRDNALMDLRVIFYRITAFVHLLLFTLEFVHYLPHEGWQVRRLA